MAVTKRGPQRYEISVYQGRDPTGKQIRHSEMFHGTLKAAKIREGELRRSNDVDRGRATGHTFQELATRWQKAAGHERSTAYQTAHILERHVLPAIGGRRLIDLTRAELGTFYRGLKLAPTTVARIHGVVRAALQYAVHDLEWIKKNPAVGVKLPKGGRKEPEVPEAAAVAEALSFLREKHPDLWVFVRVAAATGARRGEVVGLRWSDFEGRTVTVRRAIGLARGGGYVKATKTEGVSRVALDRRTVAIVRWHRWRMSVRARSCDIVLHPDGYLFSDRIAGDRPWRPDAPTKRLAIYRRKAESGDPSYPVVVVGLRTLRHFSATQLIDAGVPIGAISDRLGHKRTSTTQDIYRSFLKRADQEAAETMGRVLG